MTWAAEPHAHQRGVFAARGGPVAPAQQAEAQRPRGKDVPGPGLSLPFIASAQPIPSRQASTEPRGLAAAATAQPVRRLEASRRKSPRQPPLTGNSFLHDRQDPPLPPPGSRIRHTNIKACDFRLTLYIKETRLYWGVCAHRLNDGNARSNLSQISSVKVFCNPFCMVLALN